MRAAGSFSFLRTEKQISSRVKQKLRIRPYPASICVPSICGPKLGSALNLTLAECRNKMHTAEPALTTPA